MAWLKLYLFILPARLADDSNKMFWDSTPGKRALQALKKINPSSTQIHSPQVIILPQLQTYKLSVFTAGNS